MGIVNNPIRTSDLPNIIASKSHELAELIRKYVRAQKNDWKCVPYLALQADGNPGYCDNYQLAYRHGLWRIAQTHYSLFIDCASGELVYDIDKPASDRSVVTLLVFNGDEINARSVIANLQKDARPYDQMTVAEVNRRQEWRDKIKAELHLIPGSYSPKNRTPIR